MQLSDKLFNINIILICTLPLALLTGPAIPDIIVTLSGVIYLLIIFITKNYNHIINKFTILSFIFCIYILIRSIFSENPLLSLESSLFYSRFIFFCMSINLLLIVKSKFIKFFFYSLFFSFLILIIDSYYQYFTGFNILGYIYDGYRLSSFFGEEKILGSYLSRLTPMLIALLFYLYGYSNKFIFIYFIFLVLTDILVILAGERTSIFYMFFSTLLICLLIKKWKIYRLLAFIISIFLSTIIIFNNDNVRERVLDKTIDQSNIMSGKLNTFSVQHQVIYETSLKIFKDNFIFGIGPKLFREKCKNEKYQTFTIEDQSVNGCQTHSHNTYIQLLVETGIVGALFLFTLFIFVTYMLLVQFIKIVFNRTYVYSDHLICLLVGLYLSLWPLAPTGSVFNNWLSIIYFLPIGFILFFIDNRKVDR